MNRLLPIPFDEFGNIPIDDDFELGREVYDDREPESEGEFIDMIEQSICDSGDGLCLYVGNHCIKCREPAPWVRNSCGQL